MAAPAIIQELVERFERNRESYQASQYNETQLRREFLDPLFKALGWDVDNERGHAEAYKDVIHEDAIKVGGATKAPDYCFRIGGRRIFFLEAKKPSVNVRDEPTPAFQLRRYAWSAKLPLSILSDFAELAVYDCRIKPDKGDKSSVGRILYLTFDQYVERWDELAQIFSREAVLRGSFDKFAESTKLKRGTAEVDSAFLEEIESWRDLLARSFALRNSDLSQRNLNFAVQRTIDRIIFLRMCEDRGIEPYGQLQSLLNGEATYRRLCEFFDRADERYNSGLFHFNAESDRAEAPDELTPSLVLDDKPLKQVVRTLYYPDSPYEFSVLPAEILGAVYEQFLGKVIKLTPSHRAAIEDKPEVKKAGGVYYTPAHIVDYIVKTTLDPLLENQNPKQVSKLRILDPACGSGSFLVGAYQYLLDWHRDWYLRDGSKKHTKHIYHGPGAQWHLTTAEKKRILLDCIYGVDIDSQAVEVTKLSLLLKVLERENREALERQLRLLHERALPDLGNNIKCGNSLIGPEFYTGHQMSFLDEEERLRINVFDWDAEFRKIMKSGGFDAIVGNPPYIRVQSLQENYPQEVAFYKGAFHSAEKGNFDIYVLFVERALNLLNARGHLGFILPHKFFNSDYGAPLRAIIASGKHLSQLVHFGHQQVFAGATTYTCLMFLSKRPSAKVRVVKVQSLSDWKSEESGEVGYVKAQAITGENWQFAVGAGSKVTERLRNVPNKLGDFADIFVGLQTSADDVLIMKIVGESQRHYRVLSKSLGTEETLEKALLFPLVSGTDVRGYAPLAKRQVIVFPYLVANEKATLLSFSDIEAKWPRTAEYLLKNKERLEKRERGKFKGQDWYRFGRSQNLGIQSRVKLCVPRLVERLHAGMDSHGMFFLDNVDVGGVTWKELASSYPYEYLQALLNSRLLGWYFPSISAPFRGGWYSANRQFLSLLPFRELDQRKPSDIARRDKIVSRVQELRDMHKRLAEESPGHQKTAIERQIAVIQRQIDQLIYELYGLTDEEISHVEGADI